MAREHVGFEIKLGDKMLFLPQATSHPKTVFTKNCVLTNTYVGNTFRYLNPFLLYYANEVDKIVETKYPFTGMPRWLQCVNKDTLRTEIADGLNILLRNTQKTGLVLTHLDGPSLVHIHVDISRLDGNSAIRKIIEADETVLRDITKAIYELGLKNGGEGFIPDDVIIE